jgi:4-hydroxy-tetrahydrodipicolinate synthase
MVTAHFDPAGVLPAALTVFGADLAIDHVSTRRHYRDLAETPGVAAVVVNGHAGEAPSCSEEEQRGLLDVALEEIGDLRPVVCGIHADGSLTAARIAAEAERAGASALLVFPPAAAAMGGRLTPDMVRRHFSVIASAAALPLIYFQYPLSSGLALPFDEVLRLLDEVPTIRAMKDWCNDPALHERLTRAVQARTPRVHMLSTHSAWLMASLVMGADGLLSGAGSVIAAQQAELFAAVQAKDLDRAQAINDRLYPLVSALYADPFVNMHNRMKRCLHLLGRIPHYAVRPPLVPVNAAETDRLRKALRQAGLTAREAAAP